MYTTFLPAALAAQWAIFWPKGNGRRRFFFGSLGAWIFLGVAWLIGFALWLAFYVFGVLVLVLGQLFVWAFETPWVLFRRLRGGRVVFTDE